jgi:hypothetical protein
MSVIIAHSIADSRDDKALTTFWHFKRLILASRVSSPSIQLKIITFRLAAMVHYNYLQIWSCGRSPVGGIDQG